MSDTQTLKSSAKKPAKAAPKKAATKAKSAPKRSAKPVVPVKAALPVRKNPGHAHPFPRTEFLTTVAKLRDAPGDAVAEVAFVGRSNAGKSSAINTLAGKTRLAYVSKTPGRTQHLNYFSVAPDRYFVDLPGYGFAKVPEDVRKQWDILLGPYLQTREQLKGLVVIMDSRRPLTEMDWQMLEWFAPTGRPVHVLLSKADKLTRQEQTKTLRTVKADLADLGCPVSVQLFSSLKRSGVPEAAGVLKRWLGLCDNVPSDVDGDEATPFLSVSEQDAE
ncbi:MAG: ribosome biogenesis GTP-binding protein YihA/YsxC [Fluviibacter sp.]